MAVGSTKIIAKTNAGVGADTVTVNVTNDPTIVKIDLTSFTMASINDTIHACARTGRLLGSTFTVDFRNSKGFALP